MSKSIKRTITTAYTTRRMPNSVNGNPRFELRDCEGRILGTTRPDSSLAYGEVPNNSERGLCRITITETPTGRLYIDDVEPV